MRHYLAAASALLVASTVMPCRAHAEEGWHFDAAGNLFITESAITSTPEFIPLRSGETNMEIIAVRDNAGKVRTAFNTCQVCNGSPRAFFAPVKQGLQCQNCGNIFPADQVGAEGNGCNPLGIPGIKKETALFIPAEIIASHKVKFRNWKKGLKQ
ncbi:MAG: DUF2318 domain-containing protein [Mailhella sp.]|nr:DUF2318 domain-containing protein [Mailhella sp.]